ncbi:hypothetical protein, partial [Intestinimonas butyriciproducens]|uniref:hypothetical protein n=1 Tax=Intestinimonas butyriciproducens TaxID=1297617 RepID=UPI00195B4AC9
HCDPSSHVPASFSPPIAILPLANEKAQLSLDFFDRLGPVAETKDSAAGFFLPMEIIMKEIAVKSEGVLPKRA